MSFLRLVVRLMLRSFGWSLLDLPQRPEKAVVIACPHTSDWDFPITLLALLALPFRAQWVGKDSMFRGIRGPMLRAIGSVSVNRRERYRHANAAPIRLR